MPLSPDDFINDGDCTTGVWPPKFRESTWDKLEISQDDISELDLYLFRLSQIHKKLNFRYNKEEILSWSQEQKEAKAKELREFLGIKMILNPGC
jgi:hypothetical protein